MVQPTRSSASSAARPPPRCRGVVMSQFRFRSEVAGGALVSVVVLATLTWYAVDAARNPAGERRPPRMVEHRTAGGKDSALGSLAAALVDAEPTIGGLWPGGWSFAPCLIFADDPHAPAAVLITA